MNEALQAPAQRADSAEAGPLGLVVKRRISPNLTRALARISPNLTRALARPPWCLIHVLT